MENLKFKNLNTIPVKTYKWLNVNNLSLGDDIKNNYMPYDREAFKPYENDTYSLKTTKPNTKSSFFDKEFGVNLDLSSECLNSFNSGFTLVSKNLCNLCPSNDTCDLPDPLNEDSKTIFIDFKLDKSNAYLVDNNIIILEENSKVNVVINYSSNEAFTGYHNGMIRILGKKNSTLNISVVQNLNYESLNFLSVISILEDGAKVNYNPIDLGAKKTVTNYLSLLKGKGATNNVSGFYYGDSHRVLDFNLYSKHISENTLSDMDIKGVLTHNAKKTFRGTIDFKKGSIKSTGSESEYVMLLSPTIRNNSIPLLLCDEHDVSGTHAASSGKIDYNSLFYLMSRGLSEIEAKKLIVKGYMTPIINKINIPELRESLINSIERKLENA